MIISRMLLRSRVERRAGTSASLSSEVWVVACGALSVASALSIAANYWQYNKIEEYRSVENQLLSREVVIGHREDALKLTEEQLQAQMQSLAQTALIENNKSFLDLAKHAFGDMQMQARRDLDQSQVDISHIISPLQRSLEQVGQRMEALEKERAGSFTDLRRQLVDLVSSQKDLRTETAMLVKALRSPTGRGQWGEMQLRRVIEMSGMVEHCDFVQQKELDRIEGAAALRPDVVVHMSGNRNIVVDAKTPLLSYLEAYDCEDDDKKNVLLKDHARQLKAHINNLSLKRYWSQFDESPEFVILFVPGEAIFGAALAADPSLIEYGVERKVMLATPTTLISLLRIVAMGWQQKVVTDNARQIGALGREFYKRLIDYTDHIEAVGKHLSGAVTAYNQSVGSFERRVLVSARKFQQLDPGVSGDSADTKMRELEVSELELSVRKLKEKADRV